MKYPSVAAVGIGASTGGPQALMELFGYLKGWQPAVPIFLVVHMPEPFTQLQAAKLTELSAIPVKVAEQGEAAAAGGVYLAPGGQHMVVRARDAEAEPHILLHQEPPVHYCRPSVDVMLQSLAQCYGGKTVAVILTGMGHDGADGARKVHAAGGQVLVQDRESCVVWGMPKAVLEHGVPAREESLVLLANSIRQMAGG